MHRTPQARRAHSPLATCSCDRGQGVHGVVANAPCILSRLAGTAVKDHDISSVTHHALYAIRDVAIKLTANDRLADVSAKTPAEKRNCGCRHERKQWSTPKNDFPPKAARGISLEIALTDWSMGRDIPIISVMSRGPMQYTTRFLQTTHTRHHTILSPIRT